MNFRQSDGGRSAAGLKQTGRDCVTRALAHVLGVEYLTARAMLSEAAQSERGRKRSHPDKGVFVQRKWFKDFMQRQGFKWVPLMAIGTGCTANLKEGCLPGSGALFVRLSKHCTAVLNGVIYDTENPARDGTRCVYGYWKKD